MPFPSRSFPEAKRKTSGENTGRRLYGPSKCTPSFGTAQPARTEVARSSLLGRPRFHPIFIERKGKPSPSEDSASWNRLERGGYFRNSTGIEEGFILWVNREHSEAAMASDSRIHIRGPQSF
jgi:hypothetical protein